MYSVCVFKGLSNHCCFRYDNWIKYFRGKLPKQSQCNAYVALKTWNKGVWIKRWWEWCELTSKTDCIASSCVSVTVCLYLNILSCFQFSKSFTEWVNQLWLGGHCGPVEPANQFEGVKYQSFVFDIFRTLSKASLKSRSNVKLMKLQFKWIYWTCFSQGYPKQT